MIRIVLAAVLLAPAIDIAFFLTDHLQGSLASALTSRLILIVVWLGFLWVIPWWTARTQFQKQPSAQGPRTMTLDTKGVNWQWDGGYEAKNQFLIYSSPACFNIVPKRSLSPGELSGLRELLRQNIRVVS
jgi:heme/copper-type cytochrome/quinol oxidase subunit 2